MFNVINSVNPSANVIDTVKQGNCAYNFLNKASKGPVFKSLS